MHVFDFLQYEFVQKAFITGGFIAILCSTLGVFLVLRKLSMIGDGLSHITFGALALGLLAGVYPFYAAVPVVVIGSFFIFKLSEKARIYGDAAIGIVSAVGVASGIIFAGLSKGFNVDLFSYLFGSILSVSDLEMTGSLVLSALILLMLMFFYNDLFAITFDEKYARVAGVKTGRINLIFMFLTSISVVLAVKVVGIMLVSAMLILPAVTALQLAKSFKSALITAAVVSVFCVAAGITISFFLDLPTGAAIVMTNFLFFVIAYIFSKISKTG